VSSARLAAWVEPVAAALRKSRADIVEVARSVPSDAWARESPLPGWTYKDLLGHLAVGDWVFQTIVGAVTREERVDLGVLNELDSRNAKYREERLDRSVDELIEETEKEGAETQALLTKLSDGDEGLKQEDAPMSLGDYLRLFPSHDQDHLAQLRTALEA